jgi:iron complex transport system substrate-binding protein
MLLLLGLKDRIVGYTEFQTPEQHWPTTKADLESLNQLNKGSTDYPSKEVVVAAAPDLVTSISPSALESNDKLPNREGWAALGVNTFETGAECHQRTEPVTDLSVLYQDLTSFGVLFDIQDRAQAEIATLKTRVDAAQAKAKAAGIAGLTVMSYSGEKDPYPAGGIGTPNAIITMAGATNTFADVKRDYDAISWEEIVKRNPDVIWLMTAAGPGFIDEANGIKDALSKDSRVTGVTAVKNKAYVQVSYNDGGVESPRNVDALEQMVDGLIALKK